MEHTDLLKEILKMADGIRTEYGADPLCASHIAAAAADFCKTRYTGFAFSSFHYPRFEDERLRYLFQKEVKLAAYFRVRLGKHRREGIPEDAFDISRCEEIAARRDAHFLSADVVFLCALRDLHEGYRQAVRTVRDDETLLARLEDADKNVYDYTIAKIADICRELQKKSDEAAAIRDWKPAPKFAEPEALGPMCFEKIEKSRSGHVLTLGIPDFFGTGDLRVSIHSAGGIYCVQDQGSAVRCLSERVQNPEKLDRILRKLRGESRTDAVTGCFTNALGFFLYLKRLILLAHGDLFYTKARRHLCADDHGGCYADAAQAEPLEEDALLELLRGGLSFHYDEDDSLFCRINAPGDFYASNIYLRLETLDNGSLRIRDLKEDEEEGRILGNFYWDNADLSLHRAFVTRIVRRFGGEFDGVNISLTDEPESWFHAMVRFFNMAMLLSEFGHDIAVPKKKG